MTAKWRTLWLLAVAELLAWLYRIERGEGLPLLPAAPRSTP